MKTSMPKVHADLRKLGHLAHMSPHVLQDPIAGADSHILCSLLVGGLQFEVSIRQRSLLKNTWLPGVPRQAARV